jgi:hypothetical protein
MATKTKTQKIVVKYWLGTLRCEGKATTYAGAMRIASRNRNAFGPTFWTEDGEQMHDDGNGLATAADIKAGCYSFLGYAFRG